LSKRAKKPLVGRAARRSLQRDVEKTRRDIDRLDALSPGGSPDRPIELESPSQVEVDAEGRPCPFCRGAVRVLSHDAEVHGKERLRVAQVECKQCHTKRARYYVLAEQRLN
jgi:hypothetical protein